MNRFMFMHFFRLCILFFIFLNGSTSVYGQQMDIPIPLEEKLKTELAKQKKGSTDVKVKREEVKAKKSKKAEKPKEQLNVEVFKPLSSHFKSVTGLDVETFGYNYLKTYFEGDSNFSQSPVSESYKIQIGDIFKINIYGKENRSLELQVNREGRLEITELGPLELAGVSYKDARKIIEEKFKNKIYGIKISVLLDRINSIRIRIFGEIKQPGFYNISSFSRITEVLSKAGGVIYTGSLRNIKLIRKDNSKYDVDLYEYFCYGSTEQDLLLKEGDAIFIPTKSSEIMLFGHFKRPGVYEILGDTTLKDVLSFSGGLTAGGYYESIRLKRFTLNGGEIKTLSLKNPKDLKTKIKNGDILEGLPVSLDLKKSITLKGAVTRPGKYEFFKGMKISDLIKNVDEELEPNVDLLYALLVRKINGKMEVFQFSPQDVLKVRKDRYVHDALGNLGINSGSGNDESTISVDLQKKAIAYKKGDYGLLENDVLIFFPSLRQVGLKDKESESESQERLVGEELIKKTKTENKILGLRKKLLDPVVQGLKESAVSTDSTRLFEVSGMVKVPGVYPLPKDCTLKDALHAAGGIKEFTFLKLAELTRKKVSEEDHYEISQLSLNLENEQHLKTILKPHDRINFFAKPNWSENMKITLTGEVVYPGTYVFSKGEDLRSVIKRAGGLNKYAYIKGAVFSRESLKKKEQQYLEMLKADLQRELAFMGLKRESALGGSTRISLTDAITIIENLDNTEAFGRLVIDLDYLLIKDNNDKLILEDGDLLHIPAITQVVSVVGEVYYPSSHMFLEDKSTNDFILLSGGFKPRAAKKNVYVVLPNGAVNAKSRFRWNNRHDVSNVLLPGSTIIVPSNTNYIDGLSVWTAATQIIYQIGIAWQAIK